MKQRHDIIEWLNSNRSTKGVTALPANTVFELLPEDRNKPCPFCEDVGVVVKVSSNELREVFVMCWHCMARGTNCCDLPTLQGEWMSSMDELAEAAIAYWNREYK